jgi:hypothetical protein
MNRPCCKILEKVEFAIISEVTKDGYNPFATYRDLRAKGYIS